MSRDLIPRQRPINWSKQYLVKTQEFLNRPEEHFQLGMSALPAWSVAIGHFESAATAGHASAKTQLAVCLLRGMDCRVRDLSKVDALLAEVKASKFSAENLAYWLGASHEVSQRREAAIQTWTSDSKNPFSALSLTVYGKRELVEGTREQIQVAANGGDDEACFLLGKHLGANDATGSKFLTSAAENGHCQAQAEIAMHYLEADDLAFAHKWWSLAVKQGCLISSPMSQLLSVYSAWFAFSSANDRSVFSPSLHRAALIIPSRFTNLDRVLPANVRLSHATASLDKTVCLLKVANHDGGIGRWVKQTLDLWQIPHRGVAVIKGLSYGAVTADGKSLEYEAARRPVRVLEHCQLPTLREALDNRRKLVQYYSLADTAAMIHQLCDALETLASHKVPHGCVCPSHVWVCESKERVTTLKISEPDLLCLASDDLEPSPAGDALGLTLLALQILSLDAKVSTPMTTPSHSPNASPSPLHRRLDSKSLPRQTIDSFKWQAHCMRLVNLQYGHAVERSLQVLLHDKTPQLASVRTWAAKLGQQSSTTEDLLKFRHFNHFAIPGVPCRVHISGDRSKYFDVDVTVSSLSSPKLKVPHQVSWESGTATVLFDEQAIPASCFTTELEISIVADGKGNSARITIETGL